MVGDLELVVDHFASATSGEPGFRKQFTGELAAILTGVLDMYGRIPDWVEEAIETLGTSEEILVNAGGRAELEHERIARLYRGLSAGHRKAVMALVESLGGLDGYK